MPDFRIVEVCEALEFEKRKNKPLNVRRGPFKDPSIGGKNLCVFWQVSMFHTDVIN